MLYRALPLVGHACFHPIFLDNVKKCFINSEYIRENLSGRMELFELPMLKSGDLNLKAYAFKFLIVLLLCYNILFYFNLYGSLAVTNGLCIYIIKKQYWKVKNQIFTVTVFNLQLILLSKAVLCYLFKYLYIIWKQKLKKWFPFPSWFKHQFPWSKKEKKIIILLSPCLILFQFTLHFF